MYRENHQVQTSAIKSHFHPIYKQNEKDDLKTKIFFYN